MLKEVEKRHTPVPRLSSVYMCLYFLNYLLDGPDCCFVARKEGYMLPRTDAAIRQSSPEDSLILSRIKE